MEKPIKEGTLVVVDRDKLVKLIQELYVLTDRYSDVCVDFSCEAICKRISACEVGELEYVVMKQRVDNQRESLGCDWADGECTRNPHRCSLAPEHCPLWHGQVKSGERAPG